MQRAYSEKTCGSRSVGVRFLIAILCALGFSSAALAQAAGDRAESPRVALESEAEADAETVPSLILEGRALLEELMGARDRVFHLNDQTEAALGDDLVVFEHQLAEAKLEYLAVVSKLVDKHQQIEAAELDPAEIGDRLATELPPLGPSIVRHIDGSEKLLGEIRSQREEAEKNELLGIEQRIAGELDWLQALYSGYLAHLGHLEAVGLARAEVREDLGARLLARADHLSGRIKLTNERLAQLGQHLADDPDDKAIQAEINAFEERKRNLTKALSSVADAMDEVELDTAEYRQFLISATGEVTTDVFKTRVALGLVEESLETFREWVEQNGPRVGFKLLVFLLIVLVSYIASALARRIFQRGFSRDEVRTSKLLQHMVLSMASRVILFLGILIGLSHLGVELGPLLAGLGIAGFIIGFALQDSLANFAAGVMILGYRPFDVDDLIEAGGVFGRVSHMSLVSTTILTLDNQTLIVPNGKIWGDVIKNVTDQKARRVDMEFCVSYANEIEQTERILNAIIEADSRVLDDPEPTIKLHKLTENGMLFIVRPWVETANFWAVRWDVTREVKRRFDEEGISIAVPQQELRFRPTT